MWNEPMTQTPSSANDKADCEAVMNAALPLAKQMLTRHGEFYPYGAVMTPSGEIGQIAGYDGDEHPQSNDIIKLVRAGLIQGARDRKSVV